MSRVRLKRRQGNAGEKEARRWRAGSFGWTVNLGEGELRRGCHRSPDGGQIERPLILARS